MGNKWPWVAWRSETEVDKAKEASQANSVDRIFQKWLTESCLEPDRNSEFQLAVMTTLGFCSLQRTTTAKYNAVSTLNDFRL